MQYDRDAIVSGLTRALEVSDGVPDEAVRDIAFHMTDWLDDLSELHAFYTSPDTYSTKQVTDLLMGFLLHVPNHLAAASKLYTGEPVTDVFGIGATTQ